MLNPTTHLCLFLIMFAYMMFHSYADAPRLGSDGDGGGGAFTENSEAESGTLNN